MNRYYRSLEEEKPKSYLTVRRQYGDEPLTKAEKSALREREAELDREQRELMSRIRSRWQEIAIEEDRKELASVKAQAQADSKELATVKAQAQDSKDLRADKLMRFSTDEKPYIDDAHIGLEMNVQGSNEILDLGTSLNSYTDILEVMSKRMPSATGITRTMYFEAIRDGLIQPLHKLMTTPPDQFSEHTRELALELSNGKDQNLGGFFTDNSYGDPKKYAEIIKTFKDAVDRIKTQPKQRINVSKKNADKVVLNALIEVNDKLKMRARNLVGGKKK